MAAKNVIGRAVLELATDDKDLSGGLDKAKGKASEWGDHVGTIAKAGVLAIGAAAIGIAATSIKAAADAQAISAQTAAVLESTRGVSGMTQESVAALAQSLSEVIPFEDDLIQQTENMLLTFTNIGSTVFPRATEAALNMATALGGDPVQQSVALGKALNDPIQGISALSRVGVTFTEDQKKVIKTLQESGDMAGAQTVILKELETEFGNSGRAAGETFAGKMTILQTKLGNVQEEIGGALIPILLGLMDAVMPLVTAFAEWLPGALAATQKWFNENRGTIEGVMGVLGTLASVALPVLGAAFEVIWGTISTVVEIVRTLIRAVKDALDMFGRLAQAISNMPGVQGVLGAASAVGGALRGYADGGVVPGPLGMPQLAVVHGGETVIPAGVGAAGMVETHVYLDGREIARALGDSSTRRTSLIGRSIA